MSHVSDDDQQATQNNPERECTSCGRRGHWYLHCQQRPFWPLVADAFGLPSLDAASAKKEQP